jgi:Superfamily II DNA helicase
MTVELKDRARSLLQKALNNIQADFREGQWEAIASLIEERSKLLVVQRTGWGKSLVYFFSNSAATR